MPQGGLCLGFREEEQEGFAVLTAARGLSFLSLSLRAHAVQRWEQKSPLLFFSHYLELTRVLSGWLPFAGPGFPGVKAHEASRLRTTQTVHTDTKGTFRAGRAPPSTQT